MKKLLNPVTRIELDEAFENYDEKNRKYRDQILGGLDKVMGELQTIREENAVGNYQIREFREEIDDHGRRITKLESPTQ